MRREDWTTRLYEFVYDPTNATIAWGTNDCVMFAANCARHITDQDPLEFTNETWSDESEAQEVLDRMGGLFAAVCSVLGPPIDNPLMAQRGDVALVEVSNTSFLAVHLGDRLVVPSKEQGLIEIKVSHARCVWKVGR